MARPELIAHRGASRERPENTLPAFLRAIELGAAAVELDVHGTRDHVVVVHHDPVPRASTAEAWLANRPIASLSLKELKEFWVEPGIGIPTLASVLRAANGAYVYVEIKGRGIERQVVETIRAAKAADRCAVHGFDHRAVRRVREFAPELPTGILLASYLVDPVGALGAAGARDYWIWWEHTDEALVEAIHGAGGRVLAWTVNDGGTAEALARMGVDGLCTDDVPLVRAALEGLPT